MLRLVKILQYILTHPLTKDDKTGTLWRFFRWQIISTIRKTIVCPFVDKTKLLVKKGMAGATGNIYTGLHEFHDMSFLLHYLRPEDLFVDIGANIGSYTILASGVVKSKTISIEPLPHTFKHLCGNIQLNGLESLVNSLNIGVGSENAVLKFAKNLDTINHVLSNDYKGNNYVNVSVSTLDAVMGQLKPALIKIDVEGYELQVLKGGRLVLAKNSLKAIVIEINDASNRYGFKSEETHDILVSHGFSSFTYDPFKREIQPATAFGKHNTIYLRDVDFVRDRVSTANPIKVLNKSY